MNDDELLARTMRRFLAQDSSSDHSYAWVSERGSVTLDGKVYSVPKEELEAIARVLLANDRPHDVDWLPLVRHEPHGRLYIDPDYAGSGSIPETQA